MGRKQGHDHRVPCLSGVSVYLSPLIPTVETNALTVDAASLNLPAVAGASLAQGRYLNAATAREPVAVLGAQAAQLLGIDRIRPGERIWLCATGTCPASGQWFYLAGTLNPVPDAYAPEINSAILVGFPAAEHCLGLDGHPSEIYVRTVNDPAATTAVDSLLGAQANPENPSQVTVSQPSAALPCGLSDMTRQATLPTGKASAEGFPASYGIGLST